MIENDDQRVITMHWVQRFYEHAQRLKADMDETTDARFAEMMIKSYEGMAGTLEEEVIDYDERKLASEN